MKKQRSHRFVIALVAAGLLCSYQAFGAAEGSFEKTLKVSGAVNLDVETGSGSIEIRTGSANEVYVSARIRANNNWFNRSSASAEEKIRRIEANPPIQQSGNSIRLGHVLEPELRRNISISFKVTVPADTRVYSKSGSGSLTIDGIQGLLDAETGSGEIHVSNIGNTVRASTGSGGIEADRIGGNLRAKTGSGSIHASGIAGGLEADTGSGSIRAEQTAPGSVKAQTGSGDIELRGVRGSLEAQTGSGGIDADGNPTGTWSVHTGSGTVRLRFPTEASFDLDAETSSGSVSVAQPITVQGTIGRRQIRGKVHGGGVPVEVRTGSGSVEIL
jgi:DUF4097 and DUF4098 domain-containing protein YvlB